MIYLMKKAFLVGAGSGLLLTGLISLLIPIIPGIILILVGIVLISKGSDYIKELGFNNDILKRANKVLVYIRAKTRLV